MMQSIWAKSDENFDVFWTNDAGEDTNLSKVVRDSIEKVDACLVRYMQSKYAGKWEANPAMMKVGDNEWLHAGDVEGMQF